MSEVGTHLKRALENPFCSSAKGPTEMNLPLISINIWGAVQILHLSLQNLRTFKCLLLKSLPLV